MAVKSLWIEWWVLCPQQEPQVDAELARDESGVLGGTPHFLHMVLASCGLGPEDPALLPLGLSARLPATLDLNCI